MKRGTDAIARQKTDDGKPEGRAKRPDDGKDGRTAALEPAWRSDTDQRAHDQAEIETAGVNQEPLQDVGVTAQVRPSHSPGVVEMGKRQR